MQISNLHYGLPKTSFGCANCQYDDYFETGYPVNKHNQDLLPRRNMQIEDSFHNSDYFMETDIESTEDEYQPKLLGKTVNSIREAFEYGKAHNVPNGTFSSAVFDEDSNLDLYVWFS